MAASPHATDRELDAALAALRAASLLDARDLADVLEKLRPFGVPRFLLVEIVEHLRERRLSWDGLPIDMQRCRQLWAYHTKVPADDEEILAYILECLDQGAAPASAEAVVAIVGTHYVCSVEDVWRLCRLNFLDPETFGPEPDGRIVEMVKLRRAGETVRAIADKAGISKSQAERILKGQQRLSYDAPCAGLAPPV